jgi:hypothetical protein
MIQRLVDATAEGVLTLRGEIVLDTVPQHHDDDEDRDGDDEVPGYGSVGVGRRQARVWVGIPHHLMSGFDSKVLTFMPKKPTVKVRGRKLQ